MKKLIFLIQIFASFNLYASAKVSYLSVKDDIVYFSIAAVKDQASPACVAAENSDLWAVSLTEPTGRAMYSIVVTAMAADKAISIESANDCGAITSFERPLDVFVGSRGGVPIDTVKNCNDVLRNDPNSPDGLYTVQPNGTGVLQVYCDMDWDGAWTLVMRAKENDYGDWNTNSYVNEDSRPNPDLASSYKLPDQAINLMKNTSYKVIHDSGKTIFFKGECEYNHTKRPFGVCNLSYDDLDWTTPNPLVGQFTSYDMGLSSNKIFSANNNYRGNDGGWIVGNGDGNLKWHNRASGGTYPYESSFTVWVR